MRRSARIVDFILREDGFRLYRREGLPTQEQKLIGRLKSIISVQLGLKAADRDI